MKNKRILKTAIAVTMLLFLMITSLSKTKVYAAQENSDYMIPIETEGMPTLEEILEDENSIDDDELLKEEQALDEEYLNRNVEVTDSSTTEEVDSEIVTFSSNGTTVKYHFIDTTGSGGGDATLIEARDRYYLVDGGPARGVERLKKYLSSHCTKKNGKIEIHVAIVTHNHTDHYEGVRAILNDVTNFRVKKVLKTCIKPNSDLDAACNKSKKANETIIQVLQVGEIVKLVSHAGTQITVYGPSDTYENVGGQDSTKVNNLSMIVKVDSVDKLIIMGDLYYPGFVRAFGKYGTDLFSGDYSVCKVGHHGIRNGGETGDSEESIKKLNQEIQMYEDYIYADEYIFTAANKTKNNIVYKNNYKRFKKGLGGSDWVKETSVSGNICIICDDNNFDVKTEK